MQKTSGEIEKEFIDNLGNSGGKDLAAWLVAIDGSGIKKRNDLIAWLKTDCGFGHMHASLLAGIHANGGKPVYGDTSELLNNQFAGCDAMRSLFDAVVEFALRNFPDATILPKKTYVSILAKREFAAINIKKSEIRLGLDLGSRDFDEVVSKANLTGPMPRISHQVTVTDTSRLDAELVSLLKDSYDRSN